MAKTFKEILHEKLNEAEKPEKCLVRDAYAKYLDMQIDCYDCPHVGCEFHKGGADNG